MKEAEVAEAILAAFVSPNVPDFNLEAANVVDVIADLAKSIRYAGELIGEKLQGIQEAIQSTDESMLGGLHDLRCAIDDHE